ncbi:MAG: 6-carboxytetrahydropterin synthase [Thermoguttaceae bacterium]|nr:6-carboxytetrahydropterin synthase [Thermoguttaceae bacterium]
MKKTFCIRLDSEELTFSASHFITFDACLCEAIHGHDFHVSVELDQEMAPAGYVIDFLPFMETLREILKKLDHKTLLQGEDPRVKFVMEEKEPEEPMGMMDWMTRVGDWLSSVNQYEADPPKELSPDDYFQKMAQMAQMAGEEIEGRTPSFCGESDFETEPCQMADSEGMAPMRHELEVKFGSKRWVLPLEDCIILPIRNTTAEQLAEYIADQLAQSELLAEGKWTRLCVEVEEAPGMKGACTLAP